jgi:hypothetical protein
LHNFIELYKRRKRINNPQAGDGSLADVVASTVFDLDATVATSYPGSGVTWSNLVGAPADGEVQTAYDFFTGDGSTGTTYPTFNGTAGDPAAYWSFDGGDYFNIKSGANTPLLRGLHLATGQDFWFAIACRPPNNDSVAEHLISTSAVTGSAAIGVNVQISTLERTRLVAGTGGGSTTATDTYTLPQNVNTVLMVSHNHTTDVTKFWAAGASPSEVSQIFTAVTDSTTPASIGSLAGGSVPISTPLRLYSVAMGNSYLTDGEASAIISALAARHGRTYPS